MDLKEWVNNYVKEVTHSHEYEDMSQMREDDPCWKDYEMVGMKKKNGKDVPNCVPKKESVNELNLKSVGVKEFLQQLVKNQSLIKKLGFKTMKDVLAYIQGGSMEDWYELKGDGKKLGMAVNEDHSSDPNDKYVVRPCKNPNEPWAVWEGEVRVKGFATREEAQAFADKQNKEQGLTEADENPTDVITMDVPLFIRMLEYAREDAKTDMDLHNATQNSIQLMKSSTPLTMANYEVIVGSEVSEGSESDSDMATSQLETSIKKAQELIAKLRGKGDLEPWVQSLITKAEDYISTVTDYSDVDEYDVETMDELNDFHNFMKEYKSSVNEAEYQGRKVELGKIMQGDVKKFKVYVNNDKGNVVKVNFGQKGMVIKKDNPDARKSFRARMNCDEPGPRWKARYWSCRKW